MALAKIATHHAQHALKMLLVAKLALLDTTSMVHKHANYYPQAVLVIAVRDASIVVLTDLAINVPMPTTNSKMALLLQNVSVPAHQVTQLLQTPTNVNNAQLATVVPVLPMDNAHNAWMAST
jgi:hypothetical protein